ncbi:MAG TPA: polysaccharide biosynthesis protein [Marinilabiliales bacterium]|jgi:FlaA1/EpsC-like NDP-sugar epimerase|nr:polysaccharide biosynthesis protein [Marinilabiliales bacterium]HAZ04087.1 polysaccharide biosynthesis protein [Marinilabiliales bacterium]HBX84585.1 polysaccharide biosynthesis protein [Marinilabiliales bacterium]
MIFSKKYTPRWIVFLIDVFISIASVALAYLLRFNFEIPETNVASLYFIIPFVATIRIISFIIGKTYAGIVRYTGLKDSQRIFMTLFLGSAFIILSNIVSYYYITHAFIVPLSIVIIDFLTTTFFMTSLRWLVKAVFWEFRTSPIQIKKAVIYGTGHAAIAAKQTLEQDLENRYKVVAFFGDVTKRSRKQLEGISIYPLADIEKIISDELVQYMILAKPFETLDEKNNLIDLSLNNNVRVLAVPNVESWINGELSSKQIRHIKIEDLLEREPIKLNIENISSQIKNKVVLITGAAGSIGSEMVRQLIKFEPKNLVLFDQAETPMYDIEMELREQKQCFNFQVMIGDISDPLRVEEVFKTFAPDIVFHAAAYKHVPMMENNPAEAIKTNVFGTQTIADMAVKYHTKKFVMVSTDKAVNPTNVMGASKRLAEIYIQSLNQETNTTAFITTRFGNVLGSNGSVIPRFKKQIEEGGPITVTHPQITRYFMTIPEACQLVLEAGTMGTGGEIFIFDMGKSVKIVDLAKKMIKLSGLQLGKDIQINFTGLRPGEKLYEELLADKENTLPTHHAQIMIAKVRKYPFPEVKEQIQELLSLLNGQNDLMIVEKVKRIIPEFISQNSIYEKLDKPVV